MVQLHIYAPESSRSYIFNEADDEVQAEVESGGGADFHLTFPEKFRGERIRITVGDADSYREYDVVLGESVDCLIEGGERPVLNGGDDLEEEKCAECDLPLSECECDNEEEEL